MTFHIIPTVFATTRIQCRKRLDKFLPLVRHIHIDIMDGRFVTTRSPPLSTIPTLRLFSNTFEAHLMVSHPEKYLERLKSKGFKKIIFHIESQKDQASTFFLIQKIKHLYLIPFIAINPETSLQEIIPFLSSLRGVLVMGAHPGKEHQPLIQQTYKRIQQLKQLNKNTIIQVDGGVSLRNIKSLGRAGASLFNVGSSVAEVRNPKKVLKTLNSLVVR